MNSETEIQALRAKIMGTYIREARLRAGKSLSDCAKYLGLAEEYFEDFELGGRPPSLPQLELIAYYLEVPIDRFWSQGTEREGRQSNTQENVFQLMKVRDRIIGAMLRKARVDNKLSIEELSQRSHVTSADLEANELGLKPVSVLQLESIAQVLGLSIPDFQDEEGIAGRWIQQQHIRDGFNALPAELQIFISKYENRPYLELARRLSELPADRLRLIAEGLLEITL